MKASKKISILSFIVMSLFLITTNLNANNDPAKAAPRLLNSEIQQLVKHPNLQDHGIKGGSVNVMFTLSAKNEIELLQIDSYSTYLIHFVRDQLHEQHVNTAEYIPDQLYSIKIIFELQ